MSEQPKTYSIGLHVRRTIQQDAYVSVFVTDKIMKTNEDGTQSIDFEAFVAEAIRISQSEGVDWQTEESHTEPHPIQGPLPAGRVAFDSYYHQSDSE